jgi:hypothetical protein
MLAPVPNFPENPPEGYQYLEDEISYDPAKHLLLEVPERIWSLDEFGYDSAAIKSCASSVAVTSPFRVLSDEGVKVLHGIVTRLKDQRTQLEGSRVPSHLAGGVYRSRYLRDFCACPVILEHMSAISGTTLAPHSMPSQQLYVNYAPEDINKAVDEWHYDGIGFDYVLMMSDPKKLQGGNFEYFKGTKFEIAEMFDLKVHEVRYGIKSDLPGERVIKAQFPAAGYAIFQQGNMVVHRAAKLDAPGDRITMVPGMVSRDLTFPDPTAIHDMPHYGEPGIVVELARHGAWLAHSKLQEFIQSAPMSEDARVVQQALRNAILDVTEAMRYVEESVRSKK